MTRHHPQRRTLFGAGAAMLLLGATEAGAAKAEELDGELLARIAQWRAHDAATDAMDREIDDLPSTDPRYIDTWKEITENRSPRYHELWEAIAVTPARTPEGVQAKAAIAREIIAIWADGSYSRDNAMAASVFHDMLGLPPVRIHDGVDVDDPLVPLA